MFLDALDRDLCGFVKRKSSNGRFDGTDGSNHGKDTRAQIIDNTSNNRPSIYSTLPNNAKLA